jgi:AraC-like DNA-binding protein
MRFDYWMSHLCDSLWPVTDWSGISHDFSVELQEAHLGCLSSVLETMTGAPHARRTRSDVDNSRESCYCLFTTDAPVHWSHNGYNEDLLPGDVVLIGQGEHDSYMTVSGFQSNILKLPTHWLQSWLPDPDLLAGHKIARDSKWGRVLSPIVLQLTPELAAAPPLPHSVLVDQVGAVLALIAGAAEPRAMPDLLKKIQDCIRQRYSEPQLTAADVAVALNISPRVLHRALATTNLTFASQLLEARISVALQMLTSPSFNELTTTEIARQIGFLSASHFARAVRKRTGHTPLELRRSTH